MLNIGVIGAGRIGRLHVNYLKQRKDIHLKWISDLYCDELDDWIQESNISNKTKNYQDIMNDPEIDAIIICSPTNTHVDIIKEACEKGIHVFCEKPISLSLSEAEEAVAAVKNSNIKLQMGFNRRFDKNFKLLHERIAEGELGNIQTLRITSRDPEPPSLDYVKNSGGLFMDMSIHDFDMARYLMNSEVTEVYASGSAMISPEIAQYDDIDTAIITLKFENGALAVIENCRRSVYGYDQRVEILGDNGLISVDNTQSSTLTFHKADSISTQNPPYFFLERYSEAYEIEMNHFIDAIKNDGAVLCSIEDGLAAQKIAVKCKESLNKQPSKLI